MDRIALLQRYLSRQVTIELNHGATADVSRQRPQLFDEKKSYYGAPRGWLLTFTAGLAEPIVPGKETVQGDGLSWCWMKIWLLVWCTYVYTYLKIERYICIYTHIFLLHMSI